MKLPKVSNILKTEKKKLQLKKKYLPSKKQQKQNKNKAKKTKNKLDHHLSNVGRPYRIFLAQ